MRAFWKTEKNKRPVECDVWKKIICLSQVTIASILCERMEKRKDMGFNGMKSRSVIFLVHLYLTLLLPQSLLLSSHLLPFSCHVLVLGSFSTSCRNTTFIILVTPCICVEQCQQTSWSLFLSLKLFTMEIVVPT